MVEKRNVVLITLDSLRADHCSFMGYERKTTPTIDKMARKGLVFENAVASGVPTPASMIGVFTGNYSFVDTTCVNPKPWRKEITSRKTLAQILSQLGYYTGAIHENTYVSKSFGFNKGFKYYNDCPTSRSFKIKVRDKILLPLFRKFGFSIEVPDIILGIGTCAYWESYYNVILDWIKATRRPFFLWILLLDTHTPYIPPKKFRKHCNSLQVYYYAWKLGKALRGKYNLNTYDKKKIIDIYDDCIRYADEFVKKLWEDIKDYDPILIIHSDHGDGFGEHGFYQHVAPHCLYEELIHTPLIIYNADVKGRIRRPVSLLGISPTILELIGEENVFPSESLLNNEKEYVISKIISAGKKKIAVRTKEWKYIVGQKDEEELYNLRKDPTEQINLVNDHPDIVKEMREIVKKHIKYEIELNNIRYRIRRLGGKL